MTDHLLIFIFYPDSPNPGTCHPTLPKCHINRHREHFAVFKPVRTGVNGTGSKGFNSRPARDPVQTFLSRKNSH
ncbi:hypothetical protein BGLA2_210095 [Burkholderia gladioli]|nr:hypothetical protein BGLA2_210095 [Burkholderia gladioli]